MSETCHPGIAYILQLYTEEQSRVDTALTHSVCHMSKEDGCPISCVRTGW